MPFNFQRARPLLQTCDLSKLFIEELGWEPSQRELTLHIDEENYPFTALAEKYGFRVWLCEALGSTLPNHTTRLKLDRKLSETSFEHLIVFVTSERSLQSWMWVRREVGKPVATRTHEYHRDQHGDSLLQKLKNLYISLEEEEAGELSTVGVASRVRAGFFKERVTKVFYREFETHRKAFVKFITGISEVNDCEWYASVTLNRLMFVYFIQRKGFLDGDHDYLRNRLHRCKEEQGKNKFYTFYRYFLLRLFHEGFGKRRKDRDPDLNKLLGNIPYLNGGLFDIHELERPERYGKDIQIPDKAFERIFDYFDQYQWHLDDRPLGNDNEINPDVLGHIFEKYINQKQMGAYYTKEDITEYISKSCIIPFLIDTARTNCKVSFENPGSPTVWDLLRENPDRYIFAAIRHGTDKKLPPEIALGLDSTKPNLVERRKAWNQAAPTEYALPTEVWREVVARRQRYEEIRRKITAGEIQDINDFITLNLDLWQFAQDIILNCEGPDLLRSVWNAIEKITILDPTCGSGAFLFAALNILEPLYENCLDRMEAFIADDPKIVDVSKTANPKNFSDFRSVLETVSKHPNRQYFVYKRIILNNLFGVDIMEEAVEICKLRLFLKLASQVDPDTTKDNFGIEPLPDIDFNIRAGNTLVGYATYNEVKKAVLGDQQGEMDFDNAMEKVSIKAADLQQTFDKFRQLQTNGDGPLIATVKLELQKKLDVLKDELNQHLSSEYDVKSSNKTIFTEWLKSHQPFHWFIEFYGILKSGGFDVIIGNPPYVEYSKVKSKYRLSPNIFSTEPCGNLYAFICERIQELNRPSGRSGIIVLLAALGTVRMLPLQAAYRNKSDLIIASHYEATSHPSVLFVGVEAQLTIIFNRVKPKGKSPTPKIFTSNYIRTYSIERNLLFERVAFFEIPITLWEARLPRFSNELEISILAKLRAHPSSWEKKPNRKTNETLLYRNMGNFFWKLAFTKPPRFQIDGVQTRSSTLGEIKISAPQEATMGLIYSSLFYWWWEIWSDVYHLTKSDIQSFPWDIHAIDKSLIQAIVQWATKVQTKLFRTSKLGDYNRKKGRYVFDRFFPHRTKPMIDKIDILLAKHYGLTEEELDFILNYDIKYRLGIRSESAEEKLDYSSVKLPKDMLTKIKMAVDLDILDEIEEHLTEMEKIKPHGEKMAATLMDLADQFNTDGILEILGKIKTN
jgi:hypothetical protein